MVALANGTGGKNLLFFKYFYQKKVLHCIWGRGDEDWSANKCEIWDGATVETINAPVIDLGSDTSYKFEVNGQLALYNGKATLFVAEAFKVVSLMTKDRWVTTARTRVANLMS